MLSEGELSYKRGAGRLSAQPLILYSATAIGKASRCAFNTSKRL